VEGKAEQLARSMRPGWLAWAAFVFQASGLRLSVAAYFSVVSGITPLSEMGALILLSNCNGRRTVVALFRVLFASQK
jgi:hypothetical protein